jgi:hypothetical protein
MKKTMISLLAIIGFSTLSGVGFAKNGADDPAGHVRGGNDDPAGHTRVQPKLQPGIVIIAERRGADDAPGDVRGGGNDDPIGHR